MNKLTFILLYIFFSSILNAQPYETNPDFKRANIWHFGYGAGIDFNSDTPTVIMGGQTNHYLESFSTLCETNGNLLFYSDGSTVWNNKHNVIANGTGLLGHPSSTQGVLFVQHQDNDSLIYVLTTPSITNTSTGLHYNIINKYLNNGDGEIILKNKLLLTPSTEKLAAINHNNGKDIWILAHGYSSNSYIAFLLTKEGLVECPIESKTGNILEGLPALWFANAGGALVPSFKGNLLLSALFNIGKIEKLEFNNNTGEVLFSKSIYFPQAVYGVAYSSDAEKFFVQTVSNNNDTSRIYYVDNDSIILLVQNLNRGIQYINLIGDKIFVANMDSTFISAIENINDNLPIYIDKAIDLSPNLSSVGLSNYNQSYNYKPSVNFFYELNCIENTIQFYGRDTFNASNHYWLIAKQGISPITNNTKSPLIKFEDTGTYKVQYIASNGIRSDTISKEIIILPKIEKYFLGSDTGWCEIIDTAIEIKAPIGMHCYEWSNGSKDNKIIVDSHGIYWAKITTPNFCELYDTIIVSLDTLPEKPLIYQIKDTLISGAEAKSYQWFKNNQATGSNKPFLKVSDTGIYSLKIVTNEGCVLESDTLHVYRVGIKNINFDSIKVFPNPFNNHLYINDFNHSIVKIEIHSIEGKVLKEVIPKNTETIIKTNEWAEGIYIICLQLNNHQVINYKLIKTGN